MSASRPFARPTTRTMLGLVKVLLPYFHLLCAPSFFVFAILAPLPLAAEKEKKADVHLSSPSSTGAPQSTSSTSSSCPGFPCVVFRERRKPPHNDSYEVDFFDEEKVPRTWKNDHGGPHVRTPMKIQTGTAMKCEAVPDGFTDVQSMQFASKNRKLATSEKKLFMWGVHGCKSPKDTKRTTGCHITIPLGYAPQEFQELIVMLTSDGDDNDDEKTNARQDKDDDTDDDLDDHL
ncbi:unnamed protein product [Amoebophrya sp. A120]|nr:unnamed protein product [Amoebophrya sp. A120]|eukprot:GSA120T00000643001.1